MKDREGAERSERKERQATTLIEEQRLQPAKKSEIANAQTAPHARFVTAVSPPFLHSSVQPFSSSWPASKEQSKRGGAEDQN